MSKKRNNPWIFLRGLSRESRHWGSFRSDFQDKMDASITCVDFPGVGIFNDRKSPMNIQSITSHAQTFAHLQDGKYWLLGHSMGCLVALEWMRREPDRFLGAVFMNTSVRGFSNPLHRLTLHALSGFFRILFAGKVSKKREEIKFDLTCNNVRKKDHTVQEWMKIQEDKPVSVLTSGRQIVAAARYEHSNKPPKPVLFMNSKGDKLVEPSCSEKVSKAWDAKLATHPWGGHDVFHDDPSWVIEQIQAWIQNPESMT